MARARKFSTEDLYKETKQILLQYGYERFTFGILASKLGVSRGALYKYFDNKDVLITEYLVYETEQFVERLKKMNNLEDFEDQFDYLLNTILKDAEIHRIREIAIKLPEMNDKKTEASRKKIHNLHQDMYDLLKSLVEKGKSESKLKQELPNELIFAFLLEIIDLPNQQNTPYSEWIKYIKEIVRHGIFKEN